MLEHLLARWGYLAVFIGTALEGEAIVLVAAAVAHRGLLSPWLVGLSAFAGSVVSDQLWFLLGARAGQRWLARRPRLQKQVAIVEHWIRRWGTSFVIGFRFLYGLRTISPIVLGASGYSPARFVPLNLFGAALWAACFASLGYGLGATLHTLLGRATHPEEAAVIAIGVALALLIVTRRRERAATRARSTPLSPLPSRSAATAASQAETPRT
jgi:membrane protein DedA with SNARE-associated domain